MKFITLTLAALLAAAFGTLVAAEPDDRTGTNDSTTVVRNSPDTSGHQSAPEPATAVQREHKKLIIVRETPDTVFVLDQSSLSDIVRNWQRNIGLLRHRGIGISGMSTYGAYAFSIAPVEELIRKDPFLSTKRFSFSRFDYEPFLTSGGIGIIGLGDGLRLGGGGMTGQRNFSCQPFGNDSILELGVQISYGGFMVEKAVVNDRWNFVAGGTIGGGSIKVSVSEKNSSSWFTATDSDLEPINDFNNSGNTTEAGFVLFEPHCGASYTFFHFFHIGLDVSLPAFISVEKFNVYTNDFFTVNPGFYFKLIFGNLG